MNYKQSNYKEHQILLDNKLSRVHS